MNDGEIVQLLPLNSPIHMIDDDDNIGEIRPLIDQTHSSSKPPTVWTTTLLSEICRNGNIKLLREFAEYSLQTLSCGAHATKIVDRLEIETGLSPLHHAARHQQLEICLILLSSIDLKLGVNIKDANGRTPMHSAFRSSNTVRSKKLNEDEIFNIDSDFGDKIQSPQAWRDEYTTKILSCDHPLIYLFARLYGDTNASDKFNLTPLHYAVAQNNLGGVKQLLALNARLEAQDRQGIRALHLACKEGCISIVKYLIDQGAQIDPIDDDQWTPLHYACSKGHLDIIELFYLNDSQDFSRMVSMTTRTQATCLHLAVQHGDFAPVEFILNRISNDLGKKLINQLEQVFGTTLHIAAKFCNSEVMEFLFRKGGDPFIVNSKGQTSLHVACEFSRLSIVKQLLSSTDRTFLEIKDNRGQTALFFATNVDILDQLILANADISSLSRSNMNVLMHAVSKQRISIVEHLLFVINNQSIDILNQVARRKNRSVFLLAVETGSVQLCSSLLSYPNIRWDTVDKQRFNAFHIAAQKGHHELIQHLCEHIRQLGRYSNSASDTDQNNVSQATPTLRSYLDAQDDDGKTPLHLAAENGRHLSVEVLLRNGADALLTNDLGQLPLHSAIQNSHTQCVDLLLKNSLINLADFQSVLARRQSPLITACQNGFLDIVRLLISKKIGLDLNNDNNENPLEIAIQYRRIPIVFELLDHSYRDTWLMSTRRQGSHQTPLRDMIRYLPECARYAFDKFLVQTNEIDENGNTFERITYNYKYIDDYFVNNTNEVYAKTNRELYRNHPFIIALDANHHTLLDHPFARQLIKRKWNLYWPYFYLNIILVVLLLFLVTSNVLVLLITNNLKSSQTDIRISSKIIHVTIVIVAGLNLLKILLEILLYRGLRVPFVQLLGFVADLTSIIAFLPYKNTQHIHIWQWQLAALTVLFQWLNIAFILRSVPFIGKCIVLFQSILINMLSLMFVILPLFIAFSLATSMIFHNHTSFLTPIDSFHKLLAMNIGEFDYETLFFSKPTYPIASFLFIPFVAIMTIAFMNLLLGLTVGDIKKAMDHARSKAKSYHIRELIYIETTLPTRSQLRKNIIDEEIIKYDPKDLISMKSEEEEEEEEEENEELINNQQNSQSKKLLDILNMLCTQATQVLDKENSYEQILTQFLQIRETQTLTTD